MKEQTENKAWEVITDSPAETIALGERIGSQLKGGEVIALIGNLGTGKTHLIKGIAKGAGAADQSSVNSPTFVLVNEYSSEAGGLELYHIDAYRIDSVAEFEALGFDDFCYPTSVVLIEWADKILPVLKNVDHITIRLSHVTENQRKISFKC
ncbi:MAG TPA: tRNA (adenosine(37)-N6)-threonylcarbamoyltransferase complex ATPase subunit type 1 TsaE [Phycisphaerales bacterium]|nr:tRNA (adenosine(37)-N6)-threonylcarbamoyltransferase complex ATPase subunit type 1 TsaE [Phycisphaerales bacterium]